MNMLTQFLSLSLCLLLCQVSYGQNRLLGEWAGVITQNAGGFRPQYDFSIYIREEADGSLSGQTYVSFEDLKATMRFEGSYIDEKTILFKEIEIIGAAELTDMEWCIKKGKLSLIRQGRKWLLTGPWTGRSDYGECVPGFIVLKKKEPRA